MFSPQPRVQHVYVRHRSRLYLPTPSMTRLQGHVAMVLVHGDQIL
jgi:hypothetical protein